MNFSLPSTNILLGAALLVLPQILAALPWLYALDPRSFWHSLKSSSTLGYFAGGVVLATVLTAFILQSFGASDNLQLYGRVYGSILHVQLILAGFLLAPRLLAFVWPKGGAVALAAFRECWRQPMFWLIFTFGVLATWVAVVLPYFTFGEDFKMMKQIGFDFIMLCALLFGTLAASISISEEIEGRTAITVMSKPITRRQFFLGKFMGVILACGLLSSLLVVNLNYALLVNPEFDPINKDTNRDPMPEQAKAWAIPKVERQFTTLATQSFFRGAAMWGAECFAHTFGVMLGFGKVMILVAVASALATRMQFVVNLVIVLFVYLFGHLAPVISRATEGVQGNASISSTLVNFLARLFGAVLPPLEFFNMGPSIIRDKPLDLVSFIEYTCTVSGYSVIYTIICLIIGLLLFEDRDLA